MPGNLFVIVAPSGAGKTTLVAELLKREPEMRLSISYTTRAPRAGEVNGREYHFVDEKTFIAMLERGEFLESAEVHGNRYGTSQAVVDGILKSGDDLMLEIDWQGAQQVRRLFPGTVGIFILPPSIEELERRMRRRGQDSDASIQRRMANARQEIEHSVEFEYAMINKDFDVALQDLKAIIRAERLRKSRPGP